ncbi:MAG TPA: cytochrome c biogenesis protein CcdA [Acidimicrobiia bacterium]|nr:cytochrome c biogenesis protein CcdA [Acidimicrobiia bacterium]
MIPLLALERISSVSPLAYVLAFGGGVISFLSPCVLPLVPGYLSLVTGLDLVTLREGSRRYQGEIAVTTGMFVLGFGIVFVLLGLSASAIGSTLVHHQDTLTRVSGAMMLGFALFLVGSVFLRAPWLYGELRFHPQVTRYGRAAPLVAGAAFAFGWTPCLGPVLGSILTIAADTHRAWAGGTLLVAYTLGLGLPFLACGLALGRLTGALAWVKRHLPAIVVGSAVVVGVFGVLLLFNKLSRANAELSNVLDDVHLSWLVNLG